EFRRVLFRSAESGLRRPGVSRAIGLAECASLAGVAAARIRSLALAAASWRGLRRPLPAWRCRLLDTRCPRRRTIQLRTWRAAGENPFARSLPLQSLILADCGAVFHLLRLHLPV